MKRKLYFLAILMCILGGFNLTDLHAQTTVTIGYDSNPDGGLEWCQVDYILYNYSISQMIYTKDELEAVGITSGAEFTSIGFMPSFIGAEDDDAINRNVEVYVMNTSLTSLTPSTIAVSNPNFVGTVNWGEAGQWSNITFTTPFEYDGENILVCVNDITGKWKTAHKYYAYDVSECRGIYTFNDNNAYTATSANAFTDGNNGYTMTSSDRSDYYNPCISITFESNSGPQPFSLTASAAKSSIYNGEKVQLTAKAKGGSGNYTYSWSPATGLDNASSATPTFTPSATGTYTFTCTVSDGTETLTADVTVTVNEAPKEIVIGQTSGDYSVLPGYNYYNYSISQQIYTSDDLSDLGNGFKINSISFMPAIVNQSARNWSVYLINTTKEQFDSQTSFIALSESDCLYTGDITFEKDKWTIINFTTPFIYEGNNILVCVKDNKGNYNYGSNNQYYSIASNGKLLSVLNYNDYNSYNVSNVSNYTNYETTGVRSAIKLEYEEVALQLSLTVSADKEYIQTDGSVQLTAKAKGGTGNYTYSWSPATGLSNTTSATPIFTPTASGTYTFTCTVSDGETTATDDVTVTVYEKPNLAKQYRIKVSTSTHVHYGKYLNISSNALPGDSDNNTNVNVSAYAESNNQIFTLEDAGNGNYYLRGADGYYIKCGTNNLGKAWNVYAYSTTEKTPILFDYVDGSNFYLRDYDKTGDNYFKVENGKIYCNAPSSNTDVVTWTLEEAIVAEPEKPTAPTNLTANALSYNTIDLSWNAVNGATGYNVYLKGSGSKIGSVNGTSFQVTELDGEKEYCFTVTAVNIAGESDPSEEECTTTPAEPVGCKIIFELRAAGDYGWGVNGGLAVYYTGGPIDGDILDLTSGTSKTYSYIWTEGTELSVILLTSSYPEEMGLTIKYENGVVIRNYNIGEISSSLNNNMFLYRHIVNCSTLPVPTVNAVAVGKSAIKLTWDNLGGASGYNVYDREGNLIVGNITGTTTTVYDLSASTEYCFTVTSIFEDEESEHSEEACATTSDSDTNSGTIGNGDFTTSYIPIETYNKYSYSQQSYTKGDIEAIGGSEGYITSIAYNVENVYTAINTRNIRVFMTNATNEITFTDGNELTYPVQNSDLVFEGPVTFTPGWVEIKFNTPFTYDGNHILVTVIDDTGESDYGDIYCYAHSKYTNTQYWSIRGNSADNKIELTSSLEGTGFQSRNDIKFTFTSPYADLVFDGKGNWNNTANWNLRRLPAENEEITITGNAVITNDVTINSISMDGGSLTVEANNSLTINGNMTNDDASAFVIEDGAQVFQTNDNVLATFQMNINNPDEWSEWNKTGWQFIASPFTDAAVSQFTNAGDEYDLYKFDGRHENLTEEWRNHKDATANFETKFVSGRGYMASYESNTTATLSGTFNSSTSITYPVTYQDIQEGETHWPNFHLLGNPFTFNMDLSKLNMENMARGVAVVNDEGGWDYLTSGSINVGDGFFVKSVAAGPSVSYGVPTRGSDDDNVSDNISVRVSNNTSRDNVVLNFAGADNAGFPKLNAMNEDIAYLYVVDNNERYGIFNYDKDVKEVPLSFEAQKMGNYTISVDAKGEYETIVLVDRQTGVETNMLLEDYKFTATTSKKENTDRFIVRFTFKSDVETESERFAYQSGDELIIEDEGTVQLFDVTGRMLYISDVKSRGERINVGQLNKAAYILRLVNGEGVKVQKVIIY